MPDHHEFADGFLRHMATTQRAYTERRLDDYMAGFSKSYSGARIGSDGVEDYAALRSKIAADIARYDVVVMEFEVLRHWYSGATGFAHLKYHTELREKTTGMVLVDERENIIVAQHVVQEQWTLIAKIMLSAKSYTKV